jgi:hypothetical protein
LGFLSKTSFALLAIPVFAFALVVGRRANPGSCYIKTLFKVAALALLIAGPWWLKNGGPALRYATYARGYSRNSLGSPSLLTFARWLASVFQGLLAPGVSILILAIVVVVVWKYRLVVKPIFSRAQWTTLVACACCGVPIVLVQLSGTNHLLGHISPAVIPLAIVVGVLADFSGWIRSTKCMLISGILLVSQALMIAAPIAFPNTQPVDSGLGNGALPWRTFAFYDQWDWKPLLAIAQNCNIEAPKIAYLGNGTVFNLPSIAYPWLASGAPAPDVTWLWRYEQGPLDWDKVLNSVVRSDIVITSPNYVGLTEDKQDLDNQHDAELAKRIEGDPRFHRPVVLKMGRFQPVQVLVFVKNTFVCH